MGMKQGMILKLLYHCITPILHHSSLQNTLTQYPNPFGEGNDH